MGSIEKTFLGCSKAASLWLLSVSSRHNSYTNIDLVLYLKKRPERPGLPDSAGRVRDAELVLVGGEGSVALLVLLATLAGAWLVGPDPHVSADLLSLADLMAKAIVAVSRSIQANHGDSFMAVASFLYQLSNNIE